MPSSNLRNLVVKLDSRLGGFPDYILAEEDCEFMAVPDNLRDCCCFIYVGEDKERKLKGTGFFISEVLHQNRNNSVTLSYVYLVTAKHIIESIKQHYPNSQTGIRMNSTNGETIDIEIPLDAWLYHPNDSTVDAVILPWQSTEGLDFKAVPTYTAVNDEVIKKNGIGIGDEVCITGLFYKHYGQKRNLPILRTGNIAMMPDYPIDAGDNGIMTAYLIELRSIGGLSGSPVYVHLQWADPKRKSTGHVLYWLGLIHGHWTVNKQSIDELDVSNEQQLNTGIGIVVPAFKILEILKREDIEKAKKLAEEMQWKKKTPITDMNLSEGGITRKEFHAILDKASQPINHKDKHDKKSEGNL